MPWLCMVQFTQSPKGPDLALSSRPWRSETPVSRLNALLKKRQEEIKHNQWLSGSHPLREMAASARGGSQRPMSAQMGPTSVGGPPLQTPSQLLHTQYSQGGLWPSVWNRNNNLWKSTALPRRVFITHPHTLAYSSGPLEEQGSQSGRQTCRGPHVWFQRVRSSEFPRGTLASPFTPTWPH